MMIARKHLFIYFLSLAACLGLALFVSSQKVSAVTAADWRAGRIIDDSIFTNKDSMSVQEIQMFLNAKVPACDTYGAQPAGGGMTRAQWAAANSKPAPPYTCLRDFYEVPKTTPSPGLPANNYGGKPIPAGAKSAAQLIYDAAQAYNISPKVLLVTIHKESYGPLTVDDWPYEYFYTYAMGAYCPDGPNGAECDPNYAGFSIQIRESARLFRYYLNNMFQPWWSLKKPFQNNHILWNVVQSSCGGANVFIENMATAALYTYTPYQPNAASLNNMYGQGDGCSAYGNRNFWRIFSDWFGSTQTNAQVVITRYDTTTNKSGEAARIGFSLSQPVAVPVAIPLSLSDESLGGFVSPSYLVIGPNVWNRPDLPQNQVVIYGKNNPGSGSKYYKLVTGTPVTGDPQFDQLTGEFVDDVTINHLDKTNPEVYRLYSPAKNLHIYTANDDEKTSLMSQGYQDEGVAWYYCKSGEATVYRLRLQPDKTFMTVNHSSEFAIAANTGYQLDMPVFTISRGAQIPVYRLYSPSSKNHFYTISAAERDYAVSIGYISEGSPFKTCSQNGEPLYRLYNTTSRNHFYTTSSAERDGVGNNGFKQEGVELYIDPSDQSVPVYRLYSPSRNSHFYTTSISERDYAVTYGGFLNEGIVYKIGAQASGTVNVYRLYNPGRRAHFYTASLNEKNGAQAGGFIYEGIGFKTKP